MAESSYEPALGPYRGDIMVEGHKTGGHCQPTKSVPSLASKGSLKVQDFRTSKPKTSPPCTKCRTRREKNAPRGQLKDDGSTTPDVSDILHNLGLRSLDDPVGSISQAREHVPLQPEDAGKLRASQPRKSLEASSESPEKSKRLLRYDIWKTSTSPMGIPGASSTRETGKPVLLSTSLPESVDASLSRSLLEQCRIDEQIYGTSPKSSEASWMSRWWSSAGNSNNTSLSTCKTDDSSLEQAQINSESHLADDSLGCWKQEFFGKKKSFVSALSTMLGTCPGPQPLCPPKHDIWAMMATARKVQPTLGKMARCFGQGHRKAQSCPIPPMKRALEEASLSPSSASQPRSIPTRPRPHDPKDPKASSARLKCAASEGESMDTSYTSRMTDLVTDSCSSTSSPGLVSRDEQKNILLGRLMDYFYEVMANNHNNHDGAGSSSQTGSSSAELTAPISSAGRGTRRGISRKGKRSASTDDDGSGDEENEGPKAKKVKTDETEVKRLACPFFKRNPHRYKDQGKCVGPGWSTVHRLKEHLYRRHCLPVHCLRCHEVFPDNASLERHSQLRDPCQLRVGVKALEGITSSQEKQLRSRKRSDKTEEEKWRDVYRICFPLRDDEDPTPIPSPYFELPTPADGSGGPGQVSDMARYDEYMSRELPRRVRRALELRIEQEFSPVEESLRRQLPDIVRGLYRTLSEDFRRTLQASPPPREEVVAKDQELDDSVELTELRRDTKDKGKTVASTTLEPPMEETSAALSNFVVDDTPSYGNWATSQPIDMCRQLQPYLEGSLAGLDSWMCGVGQDARYGDWPESGYFSEVMTGASSIMMSNNDCNMFSNESMALQAPYIGENGPLLGQRLLQCLTSQPLEDLLILAQSSLPDLLGKAHTLLPLQPLPRKPVPNNLLIKALLVPPNLILIRRPHAARVGRQALVNQHHLARLLIQPKLKLGISNQDAPLGSILPPGIVHRQRQLLHPLRLLHIPNDLGRLLRRDVLVVLAQLGLGGGRVDGALGQGLALLEPGGHGHAAHGAVLLVLDPRGPRDVAAHDGLDGEHLELAHLHAAAAHEARLLGREAVRRRLQADEVRPEVGDLVRQHAEPEGADHGEDGAAPRDAVVHDYVVGGCPV
ncbi:hypothetical protein VP1G_03445 [Cytospora mali]|uniref:C2H2-type domain-containing protein n=1 Tax=Cytospora mali TaxID=578113 RepID=A0A194UX21_CYTMA|nr:hypothetical protein VP1G_03445 [Valsa mali var. pyri (nom. inval.)]